MASALSNSGSCSVVAALPDPLRPQLMDDLSVESKVECRLTSSHNENKATSIKKKLKTEMGT